MLLYSSIHGGPPQVIRLLAARSSPANAATLTGWTPLHNAAYYGRALAAEQLVKMGASLYSR